MSDPFLGVDGHNGGAAFLGVQEFGAAHGAAFVDVTAVPLHRGVHGGVMGFCLMELDVGVFPDM